MTRSGVTLWSISIYSFNNTVDTSQHGRVTVQFLYQKTLDFISPDLWLMQERVYIVQTPVCDTSRCDQRLEAALTDMGKHITKRQRQSSWLMEKVVIKA